MRSGNASVVTGRQAYNAESMTARHLTALAILKRNYLFQDLPEPALERLADLASRRTAGKGGVIFSQGDPGDALYGVASGRVRISATGSAGQEVFLSIMEPGDTFGEIAVMDDLPRTAGATALEDTTLITIKRGDFLELVETEPKLAIHLLRLLCARLRWTSELVEESAFLSPPARLAKRLLVLTGLHGRPSGRNARELSISQAELARFLGYSRQVVNHYLREWQQAGWVELNRARITIRDAEAMREFVSRHALGA